MISRQYITATVSNSISPASMTQASGIAVSKYPVETSKLRVKSSEETGARVARFLRKLHPRKTAELVACETGLAVSTVATWLEGRSVPGGSALITLIAVYGPGFLASVMPGSFGWLSDAARAAEQQKLEREIEERQQALAELRS